MTTHQGFELRNVVLQTLHDHFDGFYISFRLSVKALEVLLDIALMAFQIRAAGCGFCTQGVQTIFERVL